MVVSEEDQPPPRDRLSEKPLSFINAPEGIKIEAHDPRGIKVMMRGDEVADITGALGGATMCASFHVHRQHIGGMARKGFHGEAWNDLR